MFAHVGIFLFLCTKEEITKNNIFYYGKHI
jgi:hypothetical protein